MFRNKSILMVLVRVWILALKKDLIKSLNFMKRLFVLQLQLQLQEY